jgi:hypothetical protein
LRLRLSLFFRIVRVRVRVEEGGGGRYVIFAST